MNELLRTPATSGRMFGQARAANWPPGWIAAYLCIALAIIDASVSNGNLCILLTVPLVVRARDSGWPTGLWRAVLLLVAMTYLLYLFKHAYWHSENGEPFFSYRFFNRTFVAMTLLMLGGAMHTWLSWRRGRQFLDDPDRLVEDQVIETNGMIAGVVLTLVVATIDFLTPAKFNWAIFYAVPLFLFSWTSSRVLLWRGALVLAGLTVLGCLFSVGTSGLPPLGNIVFNRLAVIAGLVTLATFFDKRNQTERQERARVALPTT